MTAMTQKILILDFGSQYNQLIARRIRENGVYCEIHPFDVSVDKIKDFSPCAIILSGGPNSVYEKDSPHADPAIFELGVPILAICYGMQYMAQALGGEVVASEKREYGKANLRPTSSLPFLNEITSSSVVWMSHGDKVSSLPDGFICIAESDNAPFAAIAHEQKKFYGLQFHPEVTHSVQGEQWITNFLFEICGCEKDWNMDSFVEEAIGRIKEEVGDKRVLCGLSGGVDSSVAAVLIHKAIGSNLTCVFVDNGLLRKNEKEKVESVFRNHFGIHLVVVDAADTFLQQLKDVTDPEKKRKIIGHAFIDVFEEYGKKEGPFDFLAQGTLYPDVIESVSAKGGPTATIKSHHNVGGLPDDMALKLVEPLRELFKDEVRRLGRVIGVPDEILDRHPFPGPGLGVRIIGEVTKTRCDVLREADKIVLDEIKKAGLYHQIWQAFAVYLPLKTVGVMGDSRTYEDVIAVRAVESFDGMTADWSRIPYEVLEIISSRIINEVKGINRVVLDISSKPPATIEWE